MASNSTLLKFTCPAHYPQELWDSHRAAFVAIDGSGFSEKWIAHIHLKKSFVKDQSGNYLKDADGNWLRKEIDNSQVTTSAEVTSLPVASNQNIAPTDSRNRGSQHQIGQ